jgi:predicted amidophosphoribosyltransferase
VSKQYRYFCPNCAQGFNRRIGAWPKRCPGCRAALVLPSDSTGRCSGMLNFWVFNGVSWMHYEDFDRQLAADLEKLAPVPLSRLTTRRLQ